MSTPEVQALQAQILSLQQRVQALENVAGQPGEALTPYYLTVTPGGVLSANFTGVFTGNLTLPESNSLSPTPPSAIQWINSSNQITEAIQGSFDSVNHTLNMYSNAPTGTNDYSAINLVSNNGGPSYIQLYVQDGVPTGQIVALRADGSSDFLQRAYGNNNFNDSGLTNTSLANPPHPCTVVTNAIRGQFYGLAFRAVVDKTSNTAGNVYCAPWANSSQFYGPAGFGGSGQIVQAAGGSGTPPTVSMLFGSNPSALAGMSMYGFSGSGDWSAISTGVGGSIFGYLPVAGLGGGGQLTWSLAYACDPGTTYNVVAQTIEVIY